MSTWLHCNLKLTRVCVDCKISSLTNVMLLRINDTFELENNLFKY
jgi:hypothetical protein